MARPDLDGLVFRVKWINDDPNTLYYVVEGIFRPLIGDGWRVNLPPNKMVWAIDGQSDMGIETGDGIFGWSLFRPFDKSGRVFVNFYKDGKGTRGDSDHYISTPLTFERYSFQADQIGEDVLRHSGTSLLWEPKHDGNTFATDTGYYLVDREQRRHIANPAVCLDIFGPLTPIAFAEGNLIPEGPQIDGDSRLVIVPGQPEVWLIEKPKSLQQAAQPGAAPSIGTRRHIADPNTQLYYHFLGPVHPISGDDLRRYLMLDPISWPGRSPAGSGVRPAGIQ